jgi:hypothetical protein
VTIQQCDTGIPIRKVHAMNLFMADGALTETAVNIFRTPSLGTWRHLGDRTYAATFRFFRYTTDNMFEFASTAKVTRTIELSQDGKTFTSTGTVEDFDSFNVLIASSCATESATRVQ